MHYLPIICTELELLTYHLYGVITISCVQKLIQNLVNAMTAWV